MLSMASAYPRSFSDSGYVSAPSRENDLVRRLREKDPTALSELYDFYAVIVYRMAMRIVKNHSTCEDIVQETFSRVWRKSFEPYEMVGQIGPWILTVARNLAFDSLRHSGSATIEPSILEQMPVPCATEETTLHEEYEHLVAEALEGLNARQRQVIELAYFRGFSQSQIALEINQPLGTIKSRTRQALSHLRDTLQSKLRVRTSQGKEN
jgi:RNA polymerase sigma-70 factor (ECF subfamily)